MKLSEYIAALRRLQREARKAGVMDPEVAISRYSDFTTDLGDEPAGAYGNPNLAAKTYPRLVEGVRINLGFCGEEIRTGDWLTRAHPSMPPGAKRELFIELAEGNCWRLQSLLLLSHTES